MRFVPCCTTADLITRRLFNAPYLFDKLIKTPETWENTIPILSFPLSFLFPCDSFFRFVEQQTISMDTNLFQFVAPFRTSTSQTTTTTTTTTIIILSRKYERSIVVVIEYKTVFINEYYTRNFVHFIMNAILYCIIINTQWRVYK